jgi:hypothetical protein
MSGGPRDDRPDDDDLDIQLTPVDDEFAAPAAEPVRQAAPKRQTTATDVGPDAAALHP